MAAAALSIGLAACAPTLARILRDSRIRARADIELPRWMKQRSSAKAIAPAPAFSVNMGGPEHLRAEIVVQDEGPN